MQIIIKDKINQVNRKNIVKIRYLEEEFCEKSLWKAVICQAIEDATTNSTKKRPVLAKKRALKWLAEENEDFMAVCDLAGYSPKIIKKNLQWVIDGDETLSEA